MPHTSRKKKRPTWVKDTHVDLPDGWSRVERTSSSRHGRPQWQADTIPDVQPDLTVARLGEELDRFSTLWKGCDARRSLVGLLQDRVDRYWNGRWQVEKAVCVALGSVSRNWTQRMRSLWQLAFFLDVVDIVQAKSAGETNIKIFLQEPRFTSLDVEFLNSKSMTVLEGSHAIEMVDAHTLMFIPHIEWIAEIPYLKKGRQVPVYITSRMNWIYEEAERLETSLKNDQNSNDPARKECAEAIVLSKAILGSHEEVEMPKCDVTDSIEGMPIYVLKPESDEADDKT